MPLHVQNYQTTIALSTKTINGPLTQLTTTRLIFWTKFKTSIEAYTDRQMTCDGDIHGAFKDLLDEFTVISGESFPWGHPRSRFALSLPWSSPAY